MPLVSDYLFEMRVTRSGEALLSSVSQSFSHLTGRTVDEVRDPERWMQTFHPDDVARVQEELARVLRTGEPVSFECRTYAADGRMRWVQILARGVRNRAERVTRITGAVKDITERKLADLALRQNELYYRSLFENSSDVVAVVDAQGILRYLSPSTRHISGFDPEELVGKNAFEVVHADDRERAFAFFAGNLHVPGIKPPVELRFRHKDGSYSWVEVVANNLLHDPIIRAMVVTHRDISERKQAEEERHRLEAEVHQAQKMEVVGQLASGIAHDFNNLLFLILNHADLLLRQLPADGDFRKGVEGILQAAEQAKALTGQLLAFSRKQKREPQLLDVSQVVGDTAKMVRCLFGQTIRLEIDLDEQAGLVRLDPSQLEQIILNLAVNARDALPEGGWIRIATATATIGEGSPASKTERAPGEYVQISVSDNGVGIPLESLDRIFEPFFTTKERGTGLGLSVVQGIVKQNRGFIDVESRPHQRTAFRVFLPRSRD